MSSINFIVATEPVAAKRTFGFSQKETLLSIKNIEIKHVAAIFIRKSQGECFEWTEILSFPI